MTSFGSHVIAVAVVALIGFAAQRGNTCAVAAVDEAFHLRRFHLLWSIIDVVVIVAGLYAAPHMAGLLTLAPQHAPVTWHAVLGGVLLGLGACINGACTVGTVARIGSGDFAFLATPVGIFVGCGVASHFVRGWLPQVTLVSAATNHLALAVLVVSVVVVGIRIWRGADFFLAPDKRERLLHRTWNPRIANSVIGASFIVLALVAGPWSYTDLLFRIARGDGSGTEFLILLSIALFVGAVIGGWLMRRWRVRHVEVAALVRSFLGGAVMGVGLCLVPGANDGLTLEQVPLLIQSAIVAIVGLFGTVLVVVWVASKRSVVVSASRREELRASAAAAH